MAETCAFFVCRIEDRNFDPASFGIWFVVFHYRSLYITN